MIEEACALARSMRRSHPEIERAILFGSFARGHGGPRSDLDVVLVVTRSDIPFRDRQPHYAPSSKRPVDLFVYTRAEVESMKDNMPFVLDEALNRGVDLL